MRTITNLWDPKLRINWLDAVGLVVGWIVIRDDSLLFSCIGALFFAVTLGQIWIKWRMWRGSLVLGVWIWSQEA